MRNLRKEDIDVAAAYLKKTLDELKWLMITFVSNEYFITSLASNLLLQLRLPFL
jgi:hypothetical protein